LNNPSKDPTRPYYTVPLWYPYFFIALGIFFFIPIAISINLFTTEFIFTVDVLQKYGSTVPAFFYWLGAAALGSLIIIAIGLHMIIFAHKE
jgi:hypothetical protein